MTNNDHTKPDAPFAKRSVSPAGGIQRVIQPSPKESEFPRFGADDDDNSDGVTLATIPVQILDYAMIHASEDDWRRMNLDVFKALRNSRNKDRKLNADEHKAIVDSIGKLEKAVTDATDARKLEAQQREHAAHRKAAWISAAGVVLAALIGWFTAHESAHAATAPVHSAHR